MHRGLIPVMLTKEASIHLSIFFPQCLGRPEGKSFHFGPDKSVWVVLWTYSKTEVNLKRAILCSIQWVNNWININLSNWTSLHKAHRTSFLCFDKQRDNTGDKLQSHSSAIEESKVSHLVFQVNHQNWWWKSVFDVFYPNYIRTSYSQIFIIILAFPDSWWLPERRTFHVNPWHSGLYIKRPGN